MALYYRSGSIFATEVQHVWFKRLIIVVTLLAFVFVVAILCGILLPADLSWIGALIGFVAGSAAQRYLFLLRGLTDD